MDDLQDYIELPIDLENHEWFMYVVGKFDVEVTIANGKYRLCYNNPANLFEIGKQVSRAPNNENFYTNYGFTKPKKQ